MSLVELAKKEWEKKKKELDEEVWRETLKFVEAVKREFNRKEPCGRNQRPLRRAVNQTWS